MLVKDGMPHVVVNYDGSGKAAGFHIYIDGEPVKLEMLKDSLVGSTHVDTALEVGNKDLGLPYKGRLDDLRIYGRQLTKAEIAHLFNQEPLRAILNTLPGKRSKEQKAWIR